MDSTWAVSCELSQTLKPSRWKSYLHDAQAAPTAPLPQFWGRPQRWGQTDPGAEDWLCLEQQRWHSQDHCMVNFKKTVRADCTLAACSPSPPIKPPAHGDSIRESQPLDRSPPLPLPLPHCWSPNKTNFSFHQPCPFIGFRAANSRTPLSITHPHVAEGMWDLYEDFLIFIYL